MTRPRGAPTLGTSPMKIRLSELDRRFVESQCRLLKVGQSEFFAMVLQATRAETLQSAQHMSEKEKN